MKTALIETKRTKLYEMVKRIKKLNATLPHSFEVNERL